MRRPTAIVAALLLTAGFADLADAKTRTYFLTIDKETVRITGKPLKRITINGKIPGPTLEFTEGDEAVIHVTNKMREDSSIHWHGALLPGSMDGVPGLNGFAGIKPGERFTYRFSIRQSGTYWYHAHSLAQEQDGHYGSIIIHPKGGDPIKADRDYVVLFSDFHEDEGRTIMSNLKKSSDYYVYVRRTVGDFFADARKNGLRPTWASARRWNAMRMLPTDLADISNYVFLVNGKTQQQNWTGLFAPGERLRLRFINASAMSIYDVRIPGLKMTVIAADGQRVEPVVVDEFRFGVAETYDVLVEPPRAQAYTIAAESIDRTDFALATLAPRLGMRGAAPPARERSLLTMADMRLMHGSSRHKEHAMAGAPAVAAGQSAAHAGHMGQAGQGMAMAAAQEFETGVPGSGWAKTNAPQGQRALAYKDLRSAGVQSDQRLPTRDIVVRLSGNMERFVWSLNGKKHADAEPIELTYGERVRLIFVNETMMAHPMHLHGMFVQLENGQPMGKLPNKHTIIVAPGDTYSALLTANEVGTWAFHCHLLYHMLAGMMTELVVVKRDETPMPATVPARHRMGHRMDHRQH